MPPSSLQLAPELRDLDDALEDFRRARTDTAQDRLERFSYSLSEGQMHAFLAASLPKVDFDEWLAATANESLGGQGLIWPRDRPSSVAMRVEYLSAIAHQRIRIFDVIIKYFREGSSPNVLLAIGNFANDFLDPLLRDIKRMTEERSLPPAVTDLIGRLPPGGDSILDQMVRTAVESFRDSAPAARARAVEKLWDAWERLKTLEEAPDKKISAQILIDRAATEPTFRSLLETEAKALTGIGNLFHIRHFETTKILIERSEQLDYLFHRLLSMIQLLLLSRAPADFK